MLTRQLLHGLKLRALMKMTISVEEDDHFYHTTKKQSDIIIKPNKTHFAFATFSLPEYNII